MKILTINTPSDYFSYLGLTDPHPLVSVIDYDSIAPIPTTLNDYKVYAIFLREDADCIKVSTRSINEFPVNEICERYFSGGGHRMAAGGKYFGPMDDCIRQVEELMPQYDEEAKKALKHRYSEE